MSAIVVSSTRNASPAAVWPMSVRETDARRSEATEISRKFISARPSLTQKSQRRLVHARPGCPCRCRIVRGIEGGNDGGARCRIEEEERTEPRLTPRVTEDRRRATMHDEEGERHRIRGRRALAHRVQWMPHALKRRAREHDVEAPPSRIIVRGAREERRVSRCHIR